MSDERPRRSTARYSQPHDRVLLSPSEESPEEAVTGAGRQAVRGLEDPFVSPAQPNPTKPDPRSDRLLAPQSTRLPLYSIEWSPGSVLWASNHLWTTALTPPNISPAVRTFRPHFAERTTWLTGSLPTQTHPEGPYAREIIVSFNSRGFPYFRNTRVWHGNSLIVQDVEPDYNPSSPAFEELDDRGTGVSRRLRIKLGRIRPQAPFSVSLQVTFFSVHAGREDLTPDEYQVAAIDIYGVGVCYAPDGILNAGDNLKSAAEGLVI
ncbi:hypothetical protein B0O99DRAFT_682328 [Bisporella sp. PMI_857]|nr:hypothetical protein B0O99DRAFT_682328 [Bisporella sp. PMI_857]